MKQDKMVEYQKTRKIIKEKETMTVIKKMLAQKKTVNFYSVSKTAHCSLKYLYGNPTLRELIDSHRKSPSTESEDTVKAENTMMKMERKRLLREIEKMKQENSESWKEKYNAEHQRYLEAYHEILELKKQLKSLYSNPAILQNA